MCMTVKEMNETMEAIQEWKRIKEEADDNISALNAKRLRLQMAMTQTGIITIKRLRQ